METEDTQEVEVDKDSKIDMFVEVLFNLGSFSDRAEG